MVNLSYLLFRCAKNNSRLEFGPHRFLVDSDEQPFADDEIDEMYFESANWLRLALGKEENPDANFLMGQLYEGGLSVDTNHELAYQYYEKAARGGHIKACTKLGHLTYSGVRRPEYMENNHFGVSPSSG